MVIVWYRFHPQTEEDRALVCRVGVLRYWDGWMVGREGLEPPTSCL